MFPINGFTKPYFVVGFTAEGQLVIQPKKEKLVIINVVGFVFPEKIIGTFVEVDCTYFFTEEREFFWATEILTNGAYHEQRDNDPTLIKQKLKKLPVNRIGTIGFGCPL